MQNKYPKITILLAVYNPNIVWLKEQLISLNNQTYPNLELLIWDDCPSNPTNENIFKKIITKFNYNLYLGEKNVGSNVAFEKLTHLGTGEYFAYCDQDDIWMNDKIEKMYYSIIQENSVMACCDMNVIDGKGNKIANKISEIYKWHEFYYEDNITEKQIAKSFVTGCAMIIKSDIAKKALPFIKDIHHDRWLGIYASLKGKISIIKEPLIQYRIHDNNQTSVNNNGVNDKITYYTNVIQDQKNRLDKIKNRLVIEQVSLDIIKKYESWINARLNYYQKPNLLSLTIMLKYKYFGSRQVLFESIIMIIPNFIIKKIIELSKRRVI